MDRILYSKRPRKLCGWLRRKYLKVRVKEKEALKKAVHYLPKRWHERDTCLNNLKLNLNLSSTKADYIRSVNANRDQVLRRSNKSNSKERVQNGVKDKYARGSLDNVSRIPWEGCRLDELSTLRRTRSFALSRESLFYSLDYTETTENYNKRRSQLIPRAKLVEKSFIKDSRYESFRVEGIPVTSKKTPNKPQEIPPDYSPLPRSNSYKNFPLEGNIYDIPPEYSTRNNSPFIETKEDLSTDRDTKISDNSRYRKSFEDLAGLSLPNYYPDSDLTDNISVTDNQSTFSQDRSRYISLENVPWIISEQPESISYDENIVLAKKTEGIYAKPKTIRGPTPYRNFDYKKLPQFNPDCSNKAKETEKVLESATEQHSSLEFETNTNCDEIKLNNENIRKDPSDNESLKRQEQESNYSVNELIGKLKTKKDVLLSRNEKFIKSKTEKAISKPDIEIETTPDVRPRSNKPTDNQIKTLIEVCSEESAQDFRKSDDFKSIVTVDTERLDILDFGEEEAKNHSHNYLKEFLETQKGSKKPLQSFIAKKFSNLTRRRSKSNLVSNQFYSLPDITASKNLHKCEKIDRKLRKCEKLSKAPERLTENRFIVNIGKHFDITAKSTIPVDFQVKIAKVPKKNKKQIKNKHCNKEFEEAVKNINTTLQNNGFSIDFNNNSTQELALEVKKPTEEMDPEIQEKVDNMRHYWTKMAGNNNEKCDEEKEPESPNWKLTEIQTKVNSVKKKFESTPEATEAKDKSPNKVQLAKQLFEPKATVEKPGKISPTIKETCNYFENHTVTKNPNCYESLCPNSVELVSHHQDENSNGTNNNFASIENNKPKKFLAKSNSISVPEFDHVRYKVIKPELFNKKILANCETEAQFDGLMQYLQDYSFQELLIDNNIVIIEPIRSKIPYHKSKTDNQNTKTITNGLNTIPKVDEDGEFDDVKQGIRKHFFYHPIRVNKEVNDDELPNPEVVRLARQFFEKGVVKSQSSEEIGLAKELYREGSVDPDKDKCSNSDSHSTLDSTLSEAEEQEENMYDSLDNDECCTEYVSEDILEKIREYGTTVTYYGGRVVNQHHGQPILTKVIMEEIKDNEKRCMECSSCRRRSIDKTLNEVNNEYQGIKFKLVKSNSCNSRLELVGAANKKEARKKIANRKTNNKINTDTCKKNFNDEDIINKPKAAKRTTEFQDKNAINEHIKLNNKLVDQPRIIGEERKMPDNNRYVQWSEISKDQTHGTIQFNDKENMKIKNFDYHQKVAPIRRPCDMEFEPYEVA